jgi:hypothetical protein
MMKTTNPAPTNGIKPEYLTDVPPKYPLSGCLASLVGTLRMRITGSRGRHRFGT